ncbi:MAG TPA: phage resistance protein, partial [Aquabacterium sp.]|nr:phage resistance protein [Aquabacterium sp.]
IPGREAQDVLRKCRDWASEIGEIKITEDQNPVISIQVTGVDIEPILRAAEANDNGGNRRKKIRETLFEQFGISDAGGLFTTYGFLWRGTRREVEVLYENVREMTDDRLHGRSGAWTVVLDFPFDDANFGPADDLARLGAYRGGDTRTLVWLPSFLSNKALADLGRLVVLDYMLQGERFDNYAAHLSYVDRVQAKALARNQFDQLRIKLRSQLEVAYGISTEPRDAVSNPLTADQQFQSLDPTLSPRPPVGADFRSAFESLLGQLFAHQFPAHPEFDTEIKASVIKKVWPEVQKAIESPGQRGFVQDPSTRKLVRAVVNPCQLGQMGETHLLIEPHWQSRFAQSHARESGGPITVGKLRRWIDTPAPMGLPTELQNLIILAYAASTNRRFTLRGGPIEPAVDSLSDELELREQALPDAGDWETAFQRASSLFGLTLAQTLNAANVGRLVDEVKQAAGGKREAVGRLVAQLRDRASRYGADTAGARQQSAESAQGLLATLTQAAEGDVVSSLAAATLSTSEAAVSRTLGQAQACADALTNGNWQLFDVVRDLKDHRRDAATAIMNRLVEVLTADEHVVPLKARLDELQRDAMQLLAAAAPAPVTPPAPAPAPQGATTTPLPPVFPPAPGFNGPELVEEKQALHLSGAAAVAQLEELKARIARERDLELTLSWRLERKGTKL